MKRVAFENAVRRCSKRLGLDCPPKVSITEEPCPFSRDETAHIHVAERIVCIWKKKLEELTLDEIEKVAAHEVAHIVAIGHNGKHAQTQAELEIGAWADSIGGVVIDGGKRRTPSPPVKSTKKTRKRKVCSYHSCKQKTNLVRCKYCGELFCKEHINPTLPKLFNPKKKGIAGRLYMDDWRRPSHPCPPYYDYMKQKQKEDIEKYGRALDHLTGHKRVEPGIRGSPQKPVKPKSYRSLSLALIIITIMILILVLLYLNRFLI